MASNSLPSLRRKGSSVRSTSSKSGEVAPLRKTSTLILFTDGVANGGEDMEVDNSALMKKPISSRRSLSKVKGLSVRKASETVRKTGKLRKNPTREIRKAKPKEADTEVAEEPCKAEPSPSKKYQKLLFTKNSYLSIRAEAGTYFLCQALQNVFSTTKSLIIQWLTLNPGTEDEYSLDYVDYVTPDTILTAVHLKRVGKGIYKLTPKDKAETNRLLNKSQDKEEGVAVSDEESEDEEEPPVKRKKQDKTRDGKPKKVKGTQEKKERKPRVKQEKTPKEPKKRKTPKKDAEDLTLHPNPAIKVLDKDPFFESKDKIPFVSKYVQGKLAIRAALLNDLKMMKKLRQDREKIFILDCGRSVANPMTAFDYAIKQNNVETTEWLRCMSGEIRGYSRDNVMIDRLDTGSYNYRSLGVAHIRAIMASRGSREGNNALTKDLKDMTRNSREYDWADVSLAIESGCDWNIVNMLAQLNEGICIDEDEEYKDIKDDVNLISHRNRDIMFKKIHLAIMGGHRKLAGQLIEWASQFPKSGFSKLHAEVLLGDGEDLKRKIQPASVTSQARENYGVTPLHCAATNPHTTYIEVLLKASPDLNFSDKAQKRPIHYAAVCEGSGPLELLLKKGASCLDADNQGVIPLHLACKVGRANNVEILLSKDPLGSAQADLVEERYGKGGINRPTKAGYHPIHLAAEKGHLDVVKILLKHGADINVQLPISKFRVTPLMLAAAHGHYKLVRYLADNGAVVKQKDRLGRTALIHTVMNGHTHITSYLLNLGENPNTADSSNNSALHYAAAYGWYLIVTLLLEAGANPNTQNLWKVTPVSIAWMKAHMGIVTTLLEDKRVNVNFQDDTGQTLVLLAASSTLVEGLYDQLQYLIEEKGADLNLLDSSGCNAIHYIAKNDIRREVEFNDGYSCGSRKKEVCDEYVKTSVKIVKMLVKNDCPVNMKDNDGNTPMNCAAVGGNLALAEYLMEQGATITECVDSQGRNLLHNMAGSLMDCDMAAMLQVLLKKRPAHLKYVGPLLKKMVIQQDHTGFTPLLSACSAYSQGNLTPFSMDDSKNLEYQAKRKEFIKMLVETLDADVNVTVGMLHFDGEMPEDEHRRYGDYGKHSVVNFLMGAKSELPVKDRCPALQMILKYKPDLNTVNLQGASPLYLAINRSDEALVQILVNHGADVNLWERRPDGKTVIPPLSMAVKRGLVSTVQLLLKNGADSAAVCMPEGDTALHDAVVFRDDETRVKLVKALLGAKVDVNAVGANKFTPLHLSVNHNPGHINSSNYVQELLIDAGANLFIMDCFGRLPIHYVFAKLYNDTDKSQHDPIELCRLLAASMNFDKLDTKDKCGQTVLHRAAFRGAYLCCHYLLQKAPYLSTSVQDKSGTTPLGYAVLNGHDNCACMLIQQNPLAVTKDIVILSEETTSDKRGSDNSDSDGSNDDNTDSDDDDNDSDNSFPRPQKKLPKKEEEEERKPKPLWTWKPVRSESKNSEKEVLPLFKVAIDKELQGVCFTVLELPEDVSDLNFTRAIEIALGLDKYYVALRVLSRVRDKSILKKTNEKGQNLFHILALNSSSDGSADLIIKVAEALLDSAIPMNAKDDYGCTPVFYASLKHNATLANFFYERIKKLDAKMRDKFDRTLIAATLYNFEEAMEYVTFVWEWFNKLYQRSAVLDAVFDFPVTYNLFGDRGGAITKDYFSANNNICKVSPFILTIKHLDFSFAKWLLQSKASPNFPDSVGVYPLMHAVRVNNVELVKLLLDHKYDPDEEKRQIQQEEALKRQKEATAVKKGVFKLKRTATVQSAGSDDDDEDEDEDEEEEEKQRKKEEAEANKPKPKVYRAVPKKSKVNLNAQDKSGWSALHYCAAPLDLGTFDNPEIVWLLAKAGANLNLKDKRGRTPLDLALEYRSIKVASMIQDLLKVDKQKQKKPAPSEDCNEVDDGLVWRMPPPDVEKDAAEFKRKLAADKMDVDREKPKVEVDSRCNIHSTGELVMDPDLKRPYSALMTKVDVKQGAWGLYNFYKLQLVHQKGKDMYVLFTCWGRIGDSGQYQHTPSQTLEEGVQEFSKIFREKSGNKWQDIKSFEAKPKKYRLVLLDEERPGVHQDQIDIDLSSTVPSKLPPYLQDAMKEFTSVANLKAAVSRDVDVDMMPFGKLKRDTLMDAKILLHKIGDLVEAVAEQRNNFETCDKLKYWENLDQIGRLSSQYYQLIPQKGYQFERIQPLDSEDCVLKQLNVINNLLDYEVAGKIMLGAQYRKKEVNPLDYVYRALNCKVRLMDEDDPMTQYILRYVNGSEKRPCVEAVYCLSRPGEDDRLKKCGLDNHKLLWHGSGAANFVGILNQGLLVAPPGAALTGGLFGKGVYTSDSFQKSKGYCRNYDRKSKTQFMLVCEVALGKVNECSDIVPNLSKPPKGFDSVQGLGQKCPNENYDVILPSGVTIPLGPYDNASDVWYAWGQRYRCLQHNEYIVYRANQVALRYLVQFR